MGVSASASTQGGKLDRLGLVTEGRTVCLRDLRREVGQLLLGDRQRRQRELTADQLFGPRRTTDDEVVGMFRHGAKLR